MSSTSNRNEDLSQTFGVAYGLFEGPFYSESPASGRIQDGNHFSLALDWYVCGVVVQRGHQYLNSHIGSHRRTFTGADQGSVHCNIVGEAAFHVLGSIVPANDGRQTQPVANRRRICIAVLEGQESHHADLNLATRSIWHKAPIV
jgi:hypothetical protein